MADQSAATLLEPKLAVPCVKVLTSMQTHWQGLTVFARCPWVSMDNNTAERDMRGPVESVGIPVYRDPKGAPFGRVKTLKWVTG